MYSEIAKIFELPALVVSDEKKEERVKAMLAARINELIISDFPHLVYLLYRFDINEKKLETELAKTEINSGDVIADLVIERAKQKALSRKQFRRNSDDIPEEDKW